MKNILKYLCVFSLVMSCFLFAGCSSVDKNAAEYKMYIYAQQNGYEGSYSTWEKEFKNDSIEFRIVNDDIEWRFKIKNTWNNLYSYEGFVPEWYRELVSGELGKTLEQFYSVTFETYTDEVVERQVLTPGEKATIPAELQRDNYLFEGWLNGTTLFDFDTVINQGYKLTAWWKIDGILCDGFVSKEDYQYLEVRNSVDSIDLSDKIHSETNWSIQGSSTKVVSLSEGNNTFTIVNEEENGNKNYKIVIRRYEMYNVTYNYLYPNKDNSDEVVVIEENSLLTDDFNEVGYTYTTDFDFTTKVTSNLTINISYTPNTYSISYNTNGGVLEQLVEEVSFETIVNLPIPKKDRHKFIGWKLNGNLIEDYEDNNLFYSYSSNITLEAYWIENEYIVEYELYNGINSELNPTGFDKGNADLVLHDASKVGYNFIGWYLDEEFSEEIEFIPNGSTKSYKVYAKFEAKTYTITYDVNGGSVDKNSITVTYDSFYVLDLPTHDSMTFGGWFTDIDALEKRVKYYSGYWTNDFNINVTALWLNYKYTITYETYGEANHTDNQYGYNSGEVVQLHPTYTKVGYTFYGWYLDEEFTDQITEISGYEEDLVIYMHCTPNEYDITFDTNGGQELLIDSLLVTYDATYELPSTTKTGYKFIGWMYNDKMVTSNIWNIDAENIVLTAYFEETDYSITYISELPNNLLNQGGYNSGDTFELLPTLEKTGYSFDGWYLEDTFETKVLSVAGYEEDLVLYAKYIPNDYTLSFDVNGGEDIDSMNITFDSAFELPTPVRNGYEFLYWELDGVEFNDSIWTYPEDLELVAKWSIITYQIDYVLFDSTNDNITEYTTESEDLLNDPTRLFDTFEGWYLDEEFTLEVDTLTGLFGDITLYAKFSSVQYNILYELGDGTSEDNVATYSYDDGFVELAKPSNPEYPFASWYLDSNFTYSIIGLDFKALDILFNNDLIVVEDDTYTITLYAHYTFDIFEEIVFEENGFKYIYFGTYPQTVVSDIDLITELDLLRHKNDKGYFEYDGQEYARVIATPSETYEFSNGEIALLNQTYYFKVEPIKWQIINKNGELNFLSVNVLDVSMFSETSNVYEESIIAEMLNNVFYQNVFTDRQKEFIGTNEGHNVYLPSEVNAFDFGIDSFIQVAPRAALPTDYSIAKGCVIDSYAKTALWWTRTTSSIEGKVRFVDNSLSITSKETDITYGGIRPMLSINNNN